MDQKNSMPPEEGRAAKKKNEGERGLGSEEGPGYEGSLGR